MTQSEYNIAKESHSVLHVLCTKCGFKHTVRLNCGDRTCRCCRVKWYGHHYENLKKYLKSWNKVRIFELTLKNIPDRDFGKNTIKYLRKCFSKLIHRKFYKKSINGGFYFLHITNRGNGWHPHLHIVYDGDYIPKKKLEADWFDITGDSFVVWIRANNSVSKALQYLLSDLLQKTKIRNQDRDQYNAVLKGSRIVQGFGKYSKISFKRPFVCPECGNDSWVVEEFELARFDKDFNDSS